MFESGSTQVHSNSTKGVRTSPLGGNWISSQIRLMYSNSQPLVPLVPHYVVQSKAAVEAGQPSQAIYRKFDKPPTESFRQWEEERVITEFKESVVQIWDQQGRLASGMPNGSTNEDIAGTGPGRPFEMPDGWNQVFRGERYKPGEGLFDENMAYVVCLAYSNGLRSRLTETRTRTIQSQPKTKQSPTSSKPPCCQLTRNQDQIYSTTLSCAARAR